MTEKHSPSIAQNRKSPIPSAEIRDFLFRPALFQASILSNSEDVLLAVVGLGVDAIGDLNNVREGFLHLTEDLARQIAVLELFTGIDLVDGNALLGCYGFSVAAADFSVGIVGRRIDFLRRELQLALVPEREAAAAQEGSAVLLELDKHAVLEAEHRVLERVFILLGAEPEGRGALAEVAGPNGCGVVTNEGVADDRVAFGVLGKNGRRAEHFTHFGKRRLVDFDVRIDAGKIVAGDVLVDAGTAGQREGDRGGKTGGDDGALHIESPWLMVFMESRRI